MPAVEEGKKGADRSSSSPSTLKEKTSLFPFPPFSTYPIELGGRYGAKHGEVSLRLELVQLVFWRHRRQKTVGGDDFFLLLLVCVFCLCLCLCFCLCLSAVHCLGEWRASELRRKQGHSSSTRSKQTAKRRSFFCVSLICRRRRRRCRR